MQRRNRFGIHGLVESRIDEIMRRIRDGNSGGNRRFGRMDDPVMEARNRMMNDPSRRNQPSGVIPSGVIDNLRGSGIYRDPNGNWQMRGMEGVKEASLGTGVAKVRGNGRSLASADPGSVSIGHVSTDDPPTITINGRQWRPPSSKSIPPVGETRPAPGSPSYGRTFGAAETPGDPSYGRNMGAAEPAGNPSYGRTLGAGTTQKRVPIVPRTNPSWKPATRTETRIPPTVQAPPGADVSITPPTSGNNLSDLGSRISNTVLGRISGGAVHPSIPQSGDGTFLGGTMRDSVMRAIDEIKASQQQQPQTPPPIQAIPHPPADTSQLPVVQGPSLPVIQGPTRLPGSAVSGQAPSSGLPVIEGPTRLPGSAVTGQAPSAAPSTTTMNGTMGPAAAPASTAPPATAPSTTAIYGSSMPGAVEMDNITPAIDAAAVETGTPGNVIKAVQTLETGGKPSQYIGQTNCDESIVGEGMGCLALTAGIHKSTADNLGLDFDRIVNDPEYAAYATGVVLNKHYNTDMGIYDPSLAGKTVGEVYGWDGAVSIYFSGKPPGNQFVDGLGRSTDQYMQDYYVYLDALGGEGAAASGTTMNGTLGPAANPPIAAAPAPVTKEREPAMTGTVAVEPTANRIAAGETVNGQVIVGDGMGVWAPPGSDESWTKVMNPNATINSDYKEDVKTWNPDCSWYNSNAGHGADICVHPGYDVGIPEGETFNAPIDGKLLCEGGGVGVPGADASGTHDPCTWSQATSSGAAKDIVQEAGYDAQGNQIIAIYSHVGDSYVSGQSGQNITAGTPLGTVGPEDHIHVEIHGYCPAMGTWVILDPTLVFNGYYENASTCEGHV